MSKLIEIRPITNDDDLLRTLATVSELSRRDDLDATGQAELNALLTLSDAYEREHFGGDVRGGIEVIMGAIDYAGQNPHDLDELWGSREVAYNVLSGKLPLTIERMRAVSDAWGIPLTTLVRRPTVERETIDTTRERSFIVPLASRFSGVFGED